MLFISRMMSCLSPAILPPGLFIPSKVLQTLVFSKSPSLHKPNFLPQSPLMSSFKSPLSLSSAGGRSDWALTSPRASGEIHVIVGPMFAGKTTALLRRITSEGKNGRNVALIKSNKDTRYGLDSVITHDGAKHPCWALSDLLSFRQKLGDDAYGELDIIGIDEAQFFEDLYEFCCQAADHDGKTIIVAGLDGDYLRRSFGSMLDIIPLADSVTKLTARCELCGKKAYFTLRKTEETQTELIGGADVYMPVCRQHYVNGQVVMEAARIILQSDKIQTVQYLEAGPVI